MPVINEEILKNEISAGNFARAYIIHGDDSYLIKHYIDLMVNKVCAGDIDFNFQTFSREISFQDVYDAVNQFPMMSDKKCVLLDDFDYIHASKSDFDNLCEIFSDIPDTCVLILKFDSVEFDAKHNENAKKLVSVVEKSGGKDVVLNHRNEASLAAMLSRGAKKRGIDLPDSVSRYMISVVGNDINTLTNELNKLCQYVNSGAVTKDVVNEVCSKTVEASVYDYVKEIFSLNISKALHLLDGLFYMRVEPVVILYTVTSAYIDIYRVMLAEVEKIPRSEFIKDFDYKFTFLIDRARVNAKIFDFKKISKSLEVLLKADSALKNFYGNERTVLEQLTVELGVIISSGGDCLD